MVPLKILTKDKFTGGGVLLLSILTKPILLTRSPKMHPGTLAMLQPHHKDPADQGLADFNIQRLEILLWSGICICPSAAGRAIGFSV